MTLRGVIQGLLRGSDDAEALLADQGFGDLPADMFGQALASYADTAPIAEADALTPILTELDGGDPADVFAVLEEHPLAGRPDLDGMDGLALGLPVLALDELDPEDIVDGFGTPAEADESADHDRSDDDGSDDGAADDSAFDDATTEEADLNDPESVEVDQLDDDPFADPFEDSDAADEADTFEDLFDHEPEATGDDPSDLDLDF